MLYIGSALLNGPTGALDTPEKFLPVELNGVPTEVALVINANTQEEAREKQILWHYIQKRRHTLYKQKCPNDILSLLDNLSDKILGDF
jgi:hypothetical protein